MSDSSGPQDLARSPLPLSKELRDELDAIVLANCGNLLPASDPIKIEMSFLILTYLIREANRLLRRENLKVVLEDNIDVQDLEQHPQLVDIILAASEAGKFANIIDLEILQIRRPATPPTYSYQLDKTKVNIFHESFRRPYVGPAVDGFFKYLASNNKKFSENPSRPYYGKFCSIVQSSGTGKSRLLTELGKKDVLVLFMNIRKPSDSGFPERDDVPSSILTDQIVCSQAEYTARCYAFFAAIFKTLESELSELISSRLHSGGSHIQTPIKTWNDRMCDMRSLDRTKFFDKVEMAYLAILPKIDVMKKSKQMRNERPLKRPRTTSEDGLHQVKHQIDVADSELSDSESSDRESSDLNLTDTKVETPQLDGESFLTAAYSNMLDVLLQIFTDGDNPQLVIGIDEAHTLGEMSRRGFRPSDVLCRTINAYSRGGKGSIWVVFVSTTPQVAAFSAPQPINDSHRVAAADQLLYPPFTNLGWDQNAVALSEMSANKVAQFDHIVGFGRPLWKSLMEVPAGSVNSILTLAVQKLCKSQAFDVRNENQALTVLSQRFALDVCFGHPDAVSYIEKGIASHLRICYSTVEDRTRFTGYPSEPLLSCAAAHLLHNDFPNVTICLDTLKKKVDDGMFEIGQSGELTSRLLLLLAKDMYVRKDSPKNPYRTEPPGNVWKAELIDCQKVSVVDFLEHLFGNSFWSQAGDTAKKLFKHAYINFSHWVLMDELISPESEARDRCTAEEWTLRHWNRTSAIQCCHLQPLVDKMIPIYFDDPSLARQDISRVSQMFVSDRVGKNSNEREIEFITRTHDSIKCLSSLPFIALLLDLNGEPKLNVSFSEEPDNPEADRCLRIYASGVGCATFPFLNMSSPRILAVLAGLISKPKSSAIERLEALVKFGSTVEVSHMQWEAQSQHIQ